MGILALDLFGHLKFVHSSGPYYIHCNLGKKPDGNPAIWGKLREVFLGREKMGDTG